MSGPFVVVGFCCVGLLLFCLMRILDLAREAREEEAAAERWWAERQRQREESSLLDDSPGALPDEWHHETDRQRGHGDAA